MVASAPSQHDAALSVGRGKARWIESTIYPVNDSNDHIREIVILSQDVTARVEADQHIHLLMREVNHRSKNLLAVVQAIASQSAIRGDPKSFAQTFGERLQGLAASHDLLVRNSWETVDLIELVLSQLSHFKSLVGHRIRISGGSLNVSSSAAQTIGMAIHELATNAGKYGSLSNSAGIVSIDWSVSHSEEARFEMSWSEAGGPPVQQPTWRGFGTTLIDQMAARALHGEVKLEYAESGVRWTLLAPAGQVTGQK